MDLHGNAALSWSGRRELARRVVEQGWTLTAAAEAAGVSVRCARKWVGRYRAGDRRLLIARRRRAGSPIALPGAGRGDRRAAPAADDGGRDRRDAGDAALDRLGDPDPARPWPAGPDRTRAGRPLRALAAGRVDPRRRQEARPDPRRRPPDQRQPPARTGETETARQPPRRHGWEFVHVAVDDYSRLAYAEVLDDETAETAAGFLRRAVAFYRRYGITVERVLTDNGACYRASIHALACRRSAISHLRTRPYRPQTNGKAERFIRTLLTGWAYGAIYRSSRERTAALDGWLWHYNHRRRHSALGHRPPSPEPTCSGPQLCRCRLVR